MEREISIESRRSIANLKKCGVYPPPATFIVGSFITVEEQQKKQGKAYKSRKTLKSIKSIKGRKANKIAKQSRKTNR